jgi:predicted enzyme related to lactoylglutathione lyase
MPSSATDPFRRGSGFHAAVRELRLVVTATDYEEAVRFYRDVLGLQLTLFEELS